MSCSRAALRERRRRRVGPGGRHGHWLLLLLLLPTLPAPTSVLLPVLRLACIGFALFLLLLVVFGAQVHTVVV